MRKMTADNLISFADKLISYYKKIGDIRKKVESKTPISDKTIFVKKRPKFIL